MMNLFSIFDPSSSLFNSLWLTIFLPTLLILKFKFFCNKKYFSLEKINQEMNMLIINAPKGMIYFIKMIFSIIFILNFTSLFPFMFTPTAHMTISFPLTFSMWVMIMIFAWKFMTKHMLIHTIPMSTPLPLMNFMFIIELMSNMIRPITLSVRLTANMVAGHLLMLLLSNFALLSLNNTMMSLIPMLILSMLEMAVSIIQAYVFITLISLYINETM